MGWLTRYVATHVGKVNYVEVKPVPLAKNCCGKPPILILGLDRKACYWFLLSFLALAVVDK